MKRALVAIGVVLCAACGSGGEGPDLSGIDLGPPNDLLAAPHSIGCVGYVQCLLDCGSDNACIHGCGVAVTGRGRALYGKALGCGQSWCLGLLVDGGAASCVLQGSMLVDAQPGSMGCENCLASSLALLFGQPCSDPSDPNCDPSACTADYDACFNDL